MIKLSKANTQLDIKNNTYDVILTLSGMSEKEALDFFNVRDELPVIAGEVRTKASLSVNIDGDAVVCFTVGGFANYTLALNFLKLFPRDLAKISGNATLDAILA